tara:strand:+ start:556 stop:1791 length:1236 start_codon:yes stop_codon:yes gene_type:complete
MELTLNRKQTRVLKRKLKKSSDMIKPSYFDGKYFKQTGKLQPFAENDKLTPNALVNEICDILVKQFKNSTYNIKVLDPSCGRGPFLVKVYEILFNDVYSDIEDIDFRNKLCIDSLYGFDIDQRYVNVTVLQLEEIQKYYGATTILKPNVKCADFLNTDINMKFDVIVGNPPFSKSSKEPKRLWASFIEKGLELLTTDGTLSFITPSSWMSSTNSAYDLLKNKILFVNVSNNVSESFKEGGSQKFIYFIANNKSNKCITRFDNNIELKLNPTYTPFAPIKSTSYYMYSIVEKMYDSTCAVHPWYRIDSVETTPGVIIPMAKSTTFDVEYNQVDNYNIGRYKLDIDKSIGENIAHNLNSKLYKKLLWFLRSGPALAGNFKLVPIPIEKLTDSEIYKYFNLTQEEINHIENAVK